MFDVRAEPFKPLSDEFLALELRRLAWHRAARRDLGAQLNHGLPSIAHDLSPRIHPGRRGRMAAMVTGAGSGLTRRSPSSA